MGREKCYKCMRASSICICSFLNPIETKTHFVFLIHPMEYKKEKNSTGLMTHRQLKNSRLIVGIDFSKDKEVNLILNDPAHSCYLLYPGSDSLNLSSISKFDQNKLKKEKKVIFIIDGTWPCAKKMLRLSENLHDIPKISFNNDEKSKFILKQQPAPNCLSTIESTLKIIKLLKDNDIEDCETENFLKPFFKMIDIQLECFKNPPNTSYRSRKKVIVRTKDQYKKPTARNILFIKNK